MGEVFAAEDTRLHRRIAIKVLSELMASDPERRQRFEREAQAIAALNHPNIVTIYSVEEADGLPFLTMELVEGRPLGELIPSGGLPVDALLRVGTAVSDAIAAAHQRGITHRDLKPANVMVTPEGRVKVLDFGLAKLREHDLDAGDLTRMPSADLTGEGQIIGTVAYMSPEQAEGKTVDQRSDIFSLGVMLHEMSTGERPFRGDTNLSVLSAILRDTPRSITDLNPKLPVGLAKIIRRSLAKDPSRRYQTATDLRNELEELKQEIDSGVTISAAAPGRPRKRRPLLARLAIGSLAVLAMLYAAVFVIRQLRGPRRSAAVPVFETDRFTRLTSTGNAFLAAISPDGRYIVHVKTDGIKPGLWVRQTATTSDVQIVPPAAVRYDGVTYSPDGDYVYYVTYELAGGIGTLYKIPVLGGTPQKLVEDIDSRVSFSPDAKRLVFVRGMPTGTNTLITANADGSGPEPFGVLAASYQLQLNGPSWSPDGKTILGSAQSLQGGPHVSVFAFDTATGASHEIGGRWPNVGDLEWMPDGEAFIMSASEFTDLTPQLRVVTYPEGERRRITNDLNNYLGVSVTANARTIATVQAERVSNIWVVPAGAGADGARQITSGRGRDDGLTGVAWTPDGRIVFSSSASGRPEIWIADRDGANQRQLTNEAGPSISPAVTPDGRFVVYQKLLLEGLYVHRMGLDGSNVVPIAKDSPAVAPLTSPDSRWVYYTSPAGGSPRPFKVPIDGGAPVSLGDVYFRATDVSPDGTRLLGIAWDARERRPSLAWMPTAGGPATFIGLPGPTGTARWAGDGSVTYVDVNDQRVNLWKRPLEGGAPAQVTRFKGENIFTFAWSLDGKSLALARGQGTSDVVLITLKGNNP